MAEHTAALTEDQARAAVVAAGIRLVESGLIARTWGNVSARISDTEFVITPSGRDYLTLTPEEIVPVRIDDLSHRGDLKPSGERGVHAVIYRDRPDVQFVVHTHQAAASGLSASALRELDADDPLLGGRVLVADYALPSTKKLGAHIGAALSASAGHAIIMRNHGAVFFGADADETFAAALALEPAAEEFIRHLHRSGTRVQAHDDDKMRQCAVAALSRPYGGRTQALAGPLHASDRTADGFVLHAADGQVHVPHEGRMPQLPPALAAEAAVHAAVYARHARIGALLPAADDDTVALSRANITVRPLLDDFAQIVGTSAKTVFGGAAETADALGRADAVFIAGRGALCAGANAADAEAVRMIVAKNARTYLWSALAGGIDPIGRLDARLMRLIYQRAYSKQISRNVG